MKPKEEAPADEDLIKDKDDEIIMVRKPALSNIEQPAAATLATRANPVTPTPDASIAAVKLMLNKKRSNTAR